MRTRIVMGLFEREDDLREATRAVRESGFVISDVHTPYPVRGLSEALGLRPTRLPWVCLGFGLLGAAFAAWFQAWTSSVDWALNVGGKPLGAVPAHVPVILETALLMAGAGTAAALLLAGRLWPGKPARLPHPDVTDHRFALVVELASAEPSAELKGQLQRFGALCIEDRRVGEAS